MLRPPFFLMYFIFLDTLGYIAPRGSMKIKWENMYNATWRAKEAMGACALINVVI